MWFPFALNIIELQQCHFHLNSIQRAYKKMMSPNVTLRKRNYFHVSYRNSLYSLFNYLEISYHILVIFSHCLYSSHQQYFCCSDGIVHYTHHYYCFYYHYIVLLYCYVCPRECIIISNSNREKESIIWWYDVPH